jgi:carbon-monoxide dehydrogenase small subunit
MQIEQSFDLNFDRALVWDFFKRLDSVIECMPGASLLEPPTADHAKFRIKVKLGPIIADFVGDVQLTNDDESFSGLVQGKANDHRNNSSVNGNVSYRLLSQVLGQATTVKIVVDFDIAGRLAQFSRSGVVTELASRITIDFANNLEKKLATISHIDGGISVVNSLSEPCASPSSNEYQIGGLVASVFWTRVKIFFRSLFTWR